jgi:hypothetical protein
MGVFVVHGTTKPVTPVITADVETNNNARATGFTVCIIGVFITLQSISEWGLTVGKCFGAISADAPLIVFLAVY